MKLAVAVTRSSRTFVKLAKAVTAVEVITFVKLAVAVTIRSSNDFCEAGSSINFCEAGSNSNKQYQ